MTNVYGSANINKELIKYHHVHFLLLSTMRNWKCHLTIDRANNLSFTISSQLNRSEVPTFSTRVGQSKIQVPIFPPPQEHKFITVPTKSPYSPTSALDTHRWQVHKYMLFAGWEVRIVKNCDRGLENAARGRRPRAAFFSSLSNDFPLSQTTLFSFQTHSRKRYCDRGQR